MKFGKVHTHYQMGNIKLCRQIHRKLYKTLIGFVIGILLGYVGAISIIEHSLS